jgi:hypothetical protein
MEAAVTKGGWRVLGGRLTGVELRALMPIRRFHLGDAMAGPPSVRELSSINP